MKWLLRKKKKETWNVNCRLFNSRHRWHRYPSACSSAWGMINKKTGPWRYCLLVLIVSYIISSCWPLIIVMAIVFPALCQTPIIFARYLSKHIWRPCNHELALYFLMGKPLFSINRKSVRLLWVCFHWLCWTFLSNGLWLHNPCCKNANVVEMNCL